MIDFPVPTLIGETFTAAGNIYIWNGTGWICSSEGAGGITEGDADQRFVNIPGDTMTGHLSISKTDPTVILSKYASGSGNCSIIGNTAGVPRWGINVGDMTGETGGNAGSNFSIFRYDDAGTSMGGIFTIDRATGQASFGAALFTSGNLYTQGIGAANIELGNASAANTPFIDFHSGGAGGDFDGRILCSGGTGVGNGTMSYTGAAHGFAGALDATSLYAHGTLGVVGYTTLTGMTNNGTLTNVGTVTATGELQTQGGVVRLNAASTVYIYNDGSNINISGLPVVLNGLTNVGHSWLSNMNCGTITSNWISASGDISTNGYLHCNGRINISGGEFSLWADSANSGSPYLTFENSAGVYFTYNKANGTMAYFKGSAAYTDWIWNKDLVHYGNAFKPGGGVWGANSDERIKNVLGDYTNGLDQIKQLTPVRFTYKGNDLNAVASEEDLSAVRTAGAFPRSLHYDAAVSGREFIGLVAQQAEIPMPELVQQVEGYIDGVKVTDLRTFDSTAITYALVNAVKELSAINESLTARIAALELSARVSALETRK